MSDFIVLALLAPGLHTSRPAMHDLVAKAITHYSNTEPEIEQSSDGKEITAS